MNRTHRYSELARLARLGFPALAAFLAVACVDDPVPPAAAEDAAGDAALDATPDSGPDAEPDAVADAPEDTAGTDVPDADEGDADYLSAHCREQIGPPRVIAVTDDLFVAVGFDLANTILLRTDAGNVVIDVSMSPERAELVRAALDEVAPGPVSAVIYTHSHIDHVGGARVWVEEGTEVWATDALLPGFLRQYGAFRAAESERGRRQFGEHVHPDDLPCNAIGARADVEAATDTGFIVPTHTFSGRAEIEVGGVPITLIELHGETDDQLAVWLPSLGALLPGDNVYTSFPNLYTIRGTRPRDVQAWVRSLDTMRSLAPELLVPSHTLPVVGADTVRATLRDYRDAIEWLRAQVVRGANRLDPLDTIVAAASLPQHLAELPALRETYGQVDWSARAIYLNELGWFDGRAEVLYPPADLARRELELMGGAAAVEAEARAALAAGDARWAAHLLGRLRDAGLREESALADDLAAAFRAIAAGIDNANGRGYLLERALELEGAAGPIPTPTVSDALLDAIPPALVFDILTTRVRVDRAATTEASMTVVLTDLGERWHITVRRGVAEVWEGEPLPGTPAPSATLTTTARTWVGLAVGAIEPAAALIAGDLAIDNAGAALSFLDLFEDGV